jgi:serine/threonine-protein kinase HipA
VEGRGVNATYTRHWMSLNGSRDDFTRDDIYSLEKLVPKFTQKYIDQIIDQTIENFSRWATLAKESGVPDFRISEIGPNLRLKL